MDDWTVVYFDGLEGPFYDQDGIGELTIPAGHKVIWYEAMPRPEMDAKIKPQPEVYPDDGKQSAVGFLPFKTFRWWCYTEVPIAVSAGLRTRADVQVMVVAHGIGGDDSRLGDCGMRLGISPASVYDPQSDQILWSEWRTVRTPGQPGANLKEREWVAVQTPEYVPNVGEVRLWVQCNANIKAAISAGHWDNERVLQSDDTKPGDGVTEARVVEIVSEMVPGMIKMYAPKVIIDKLSET